MNDTPPPIERAIKDATKDRSLADELLQAADLRELHTLCKRMIDEREALAKGFNAVVQGWSMIDNKGPSTSDPDAIAAIERIATEAIQFAREVVQAMKQPVVK